MMSPPDLADLIALAGQRGGQVVIAGDTGQLQAVQNGGGMSVLAARFGQVRKQRLHRDYAQEPAETLDIKL